MASSRKRDEPRPTDAYGRSKLEAEQGLRHARHRLGGAAAGAGLRAGREGQHGGAAAPGAIALAAAARRPAGASARCSPSTTSPAAIDAVLRAPGPLRRPFIVADPEPLNVAGDRRALCARARARAGPDPGAVLHAAPAARCWPGRSEAYRPAGRIAGGEPEALIRPRLAAGQFDARRTGTCWRGSSSPGG